MPPLHDDMRPSLFQCRKKLVKVLAFRNIRVFRNPRGNDKMRCTCIPLDLTRPLQCAIIISENILQEVNP